MRVAEADVLVLIMKLVILASLGDSRVASRRPLRMAEPMFPALAG